ncbi:MAG: NAD(P)/FAD-dependent oxidoreductase [Proteobacteria bacterium]|nr:NAD(P)/FAD-dependent oxidoreductase [Pseudomonadota bacterium]
MKGSNSNDYDVIIVGAGPNGLCCGAYLAAAGARVAVLEKYVETGGGLVTQELSGFRLNHHAVYMLLAELMPPVSELDLASRGVAFARPARQAAFLYEGGHSITLALDPAESQRSIEALSLGDGSRFRRMADEMAQMCERFLVPATYFPPIPPIEQTELLENSDELGKRMAAFSEMTPREVIADYGFEDPRVEAAFLYLACVFGLDPDEGGLGFLVPIYVHRLLNNSIVRGGSHQLSSALRRGLEEHGGDVITGCAARSLLTEGGRVVGVLAADGREFRARAVVSTLNPEQTFTGLAAGCELPVHFKQVAEQWEWEHTSMFIVNSGIVGEAPRYEGYDKSVDEALMVVMGYQSPEDVVAHYAAASAGEARADAGHASVPSLFDPLQSPAHVPLGPVHALRWETWAPYDRPWGEEAAGFAESCMQTWQRYAPNLAEANCRVRVHWSPHDIAEHLATMKRGSIKHGAYSSLQMGFNRPLPECSSNRTPLAGLYVGGASTHPGGMVIMGPGYNCSRVVAADLGIQLPWEEPEMVAAAKRSGYLSDEAVEEMP